VLRIAVGSREDVRVINGLTETETTTVMVVIKVRLTVQADKENTHLKPNGQEV
jgi:hypothetical protein